MHKVSFAQSTGCFILPAAASTWRVKRIIKAQSICTFYNEKIGCVYTCNSVNCRTIDTYAQTHAHSFSFLTIRHIPFDVLWCLSMLIFFFEIRKLTTNKCERNEKRQSLASIIVYACVCCARCACLCVVASVCCHFMIIVGYIEY